MAADGREGERRGDIRPATILAEHIVIDKHAAPRAPQRHQHEVHADSRLTVLQDHLPHVPQRMGCAETPLIGLGFILRLGEVGFRLSEGLFARFQRR